jgi:hypothetical protein
MSQVLLEMKQLLLQFAESSEGGVMKRMLHFLKAQGFRQHFEEQEQELRHCLVQLSAVLNVVQVTSQVGAAASDNARPSQLPHCPHRLLTNPPLLCYVNAHPASCAVCCNLLGMQRSGALMLPARTPGLGTTLRGR